MSVQKTTLRVIPWLHTTLIYAPFYTVILMLITQKENTASAQFFFGALLFLIPAAVTSLAAEHSKSLWLYILVSVLAVALTFLLTGCFVSLAALALMVVIRLVGRIRETHTVFDTPHPVGIVFFAVPFIYSGIVGDVFLQTATVMVSALYVALVFLYRGLLRIQNYTAMNETMANFPGRRIRKSSGMIFALASAAMLAVVIPTLLLGFRFVPINFDSKTVSIPLPPAQATQAESNEMERPEWMAAMEEQGEPLIDLSFLGDIFMVVALVFFVGLVFYGIYRLSKNFSKTVLEKNDLIESTADFSENLLINPKKERLRRLDFSPNATIRRKYKKSILRAKKETPESWLSPREIEKEAGLENPELHALYERARYSKDGIQK